MASRVIARQSSTQCSGRVRLVTRTLRYVLFHTHAVAYYSVSQSGCLCVWLVSNLLGSAVDDAVRASAELLIEDRIHLRVQTQQNTGNYRLEAAMLIPARLLGTRV